MPTKPLSPCSVRSCPNAAFSRGRCEAHQQPRQFVDRADQRPTRQEARRLAGPKSRLPKAQKPWSRLASLCRVGKDQAEKDRRRAGASGPDISPAQAPSRLAPGRTRGSPQGYPGQARPQQHRRDRRHLRPPVPGHDRETAQLLGHSLENWRNLITVKSLSTPDSDSRGGQGSKENPLQKPI